MPDGVPTPKEQQEILERRLVAAVADEFRFGALSDADYGYRPEHLGDHAHAEGRASELRDAAQEFGIALPATSDVEKKARAVLREEYEQAARDHEELLGEVDEVSLEMSVKTSGPGRLSGDRQRLLEAEEAVRESGPILNYLNDMEEDARWREACASGPTGRTSKLATEVE